jgi:hypothetical protein
MGFQYTTNEVDVNEAQTNQLGNYAKEPEYKENNER